MNDRALKKLIREFREGMLEGQASTSMCFALCWPLQGYLGVHGVHTKLIEVELDVPGLGLTNHFWLELEDERILDPTADQFREAKLPKVYLGPVPDVYRAWLRTRRER